MNAADRFASLPSLRDGDHDLKRRGRWVNVECRVDIGDEPLFLAITVCCGASVRLWAHLRHAAGPLGCPLFGGKADLPGRVSGLLRLTGKSLDHEARSALAILRQAL